MSRRTSFPPGAPCWINLLTSDPERSRRFYTELLGWTAEDPDPIHGGYVNFRKDGVRVAGCVGKRPGMEQAPDAWSVYLFSRDARATVEAATRHGGQVMQPAMDVGDLGVMAMVSDPSGAAVGIWQPGAHPGFGVAYEAGAGAWFELHTTRYRKCLDFYRDVFGWTAQTLSETPQFRYSILVDGDEQLAGVMDDTVFAPEGAPSYWLTYLGVGDTDAALQRITALGGTVTRDAEDTPYGRLASVRDPNGASFNVVGPNLGAQADAPQATAAAP